MDNLYPGGVISLQCADDTLLFLKYDFSLPDYLKWLMACFEKLFDMKIYYHKSDLTPINLEEEDSQHYYCTIRETRKEEKFANG
jgi:hypothetical protein